MSIRPATVHDARAIAELLCDIEDYPHWREQGADTLEAQVKASLERTHDQRVVLVSELEGRVVGYTAVYWLHYLFSRQEGYVSELFIGNDASGRGVGTALLEVIKAEARVRGCGRLTLINLKNRASYQRQFYAKKGWVERPETVRFVFDLEVKS